MRFLLKLIVLIVVVVIAAGIYIWSGHYNIGADSPHWAVTSKVIGELRAHSIDARAKEIQVPALDAPAMLKEGAEHYAEMCTGCHLAPGMDESELRVGLYPKPPNLTRFAPHPAEAFWVIKHGVKMTAMPAWGKTHDDQKIWAMVAYLQQQPHMSVQRYHELTADSKQVEALEHDAMPGMHGVPGAPASTPAPAASVHH
jgi:mono/diheme cytochrome c family protein